MTGSLAPSAGSGGSITFSTASAGPAVWPKSAPSSPRSLTEPTTSAAITGGSARTTGIWETPYSRRIPTASAMVSIGWVCTSDGSSPDFSRSTSPTTRTEASGRAAKP